MVEVTNIRQYSSKTNKLQNVYTIGRWARYIPVKKWEINYFKIKFILFIINLDETISFFMDESKSKKGASVLEEFALFKVRKKTKIRNRYNQISHQTQDTIW